MTKSAEDMDESVISGLREQILANAAQLFPELVKKHLTYHKIDIAKPDEIFAVITMTEMRPSWTFENTYAVLTYGNPMARENAIKGPQSINVQGALRGLLTATNVALSVTKSEAVERDLTQKGFLDLGGAWIKKELLPRDFEAPSGCAIQ